MVRSLDKSLSPSSSFKLKLALSSGSYKTTWLAGTSNTCVVYNCVSNTLSLLGTNLMLRLLAFKGIISFSAKTFVVLSVRVAVSS